MFLLGTFYFFASFLIVTCISVIFSKNPVNSVLFLVLAFLNSTFLFILIGAEFVGIILAIVYIGAVAILFLFVVMMLDIQITTLMFNIKRYIPLALLFAGVILAEIIYLTVFKSSKSNLNEIVRSSNNTEEIGNVLYTKYFIDFQLSGVVLLLAMIGAIVLTHVYRPSIKRQNIDKQNTTYSKDRIQLVETKSGEGVNYNE
ncbi:NADH-ubiquinone/plastoquinone oxidoreductase chain 6 [alpha proteobacterium HIMB59]|jgi:NADH-quinone oxidoreductase subunit J|nr:NADH-ubiquinone/plastoquinone oxidoreductase chain 6 [alpha proteobacterium HIMB59]|tara:strand:- start:999 stop:1601 length:603 start_codon:yes stop_codon:yes gene_type:complete